MVFDFTLFIITSKPKKNCNFLISKLRYQGMSVIHFYEVRGRTRRLRNNVHIWWGNVSYAQFAPKGAKFMGIRTALSETKLSKASFTYLVHMFTTGFWLPDRDEL